MALNSKHIQEAVDRLFSKNRYVLFNSYVFDWESDYLGFTYPAQLCVEVEIKVSVSDYKKDFTKIEKHLLLSNTHKDILTIPSSSVRTTGGWEPNAEGIMIRWNTEFCDVSFKNPKMCTPNRFYFAAPKGLLSGQKLPKYAGLIEVEGEEKSPWAMITKTAPKLHKENIFEKKSIALRDKFWWEVNSLRQSTKWRYWQENRIKELEKAMESLHSEIRKQDEIIRNYEKQTKTDS